MDMSQNNLTWDLDMAMNTPFFPDQLPYDLLNQNSLLQGPKAHSSIHVPTSSFQRERVERQEEGDEDEEELSAMKEMMYKIAAMQPVDIDPATINKPKRRNVRISDDPQSVAARHRREKISQRIRILQRLVPGGTKMDTASMLDEAIRYVKFLKRQVHKLQSHQQQQPFLGATSILEDGSCPTNTQDIHGSISSPVGLNHGYSPCDNH